jgi:predicted ester cyclase
MPPGAHEGEIMSGEALTCETNKEIVRRIYEEGYSQGDVSIYEELYQPDFVHHSKTIHDIEPGAADEAESMIRVRRAIPDVQFTVLDQIAERDLVATRLRIHGRRPLTMGTCARINPRSPAHRENNEMAKRRQRDRRRTLERHIEADKGPFEWVDYLGTRMFVMGYTPGGAPYLSTLLVHSYPFRSPANTAG